MRLPACALVALLLALSSSIACPPTGTDGEGEGEGEGTEGEGEGEGENPGEGEGENPGEGEGENPGEGEGEDPGEGEGEGEGPVDSTCFKDGACRADLICRFADPNDDNFVSDGLCQPSNGGGDTGSICDVADDCDRGVCVGNVCSALCLDDNDCPSAMACRLTSFGVDDGTAGVAEICVIDTSAPPVPCDDDSACSASNRICNDVTASNDLVCGFPGTGAAYGEACASLFEDRTACATGLCDGSTAGMCTRACTVDSQCGDGFICGGAIFSNIPGSFCVDRCVRNNQCDAGRTCQLRDSRDDSRFDTVCAEQAGDLAAGTPTSNGRECPSALLIDGECSELCVVDTDCPAVLPKCSPVTFAQPGRQPQTITACTAP